MSLVLDGITAFEYWMSAAWIDGATPIRGTNAQLTDFSTTSAKEVSTAIQRKDGAQGYIQLLVGASGERRPCSNIECYVWPQKYPLPQHALYRIGPSTFVVSPELCLVRLATMLPPLELQRAVFDMLGMYGLSITNRMDLIGRQPITNKARIQAFLAQIKGARGTKKLERILPWSIEGSASPRETSMNLVLAMPARMGGQGMPLFAANYEISLTDEAKHLTRKGYLVADAMWPEQNLALEYNSSKYHDSEEQKEFDFEKITALESMGKIVVPLSTRQFNDYEAFSAVVKTLRNIMHVRSTTSAQTNERRRGVHEELLRIERSNRELPSLMDTKRWQYLFPRLDLTGGLPPVAEH